jgi:hypothetical protein
MLIHGIEWYNLSISCFVVVFVFYGKVIVKCRKNSGFRIIEMKNWGVTI